MNSGKTFPQHLILDVGPALLASDLIDVDLPLREELVSQAYDALGDHSHDLNLSLVDQGPHTRVRLNTEQLSEVGVTYLGELGDRFERLYIALSEQLITAGGADREVDPSHPDEWKRGTH